MRLTEYERTAQRDVERWERGESLVQQALSFAMKPVDWAFDRFVPPTPSWTRSRTRSRPP